MKQYVSVFGTPVSTQTVAYVISIILLFFLVNVNRDLGIIFGIMIVVDFLMYNFGSWRTKFPFEKDAARLKDVAMGVTAYGLFILIAAVVAAIVAGVATMGPTQSVFASMAAQTPILGDSVIASIIGWGILIPIVETSFFFGRLLEFSANAFKVPLDSVKNWKTLVLFGVVASIFTLFHLTARAQAVSGGKIVFDNVGLASTFIFGYLSCMLVVLLKELTTATYLHITSNTLAVAINAKIQAVQSILGLT